MTFKLLGRFDVESPEWFDARQDRLGGSEVAAILGLSPYESRFSLWHRKKGLVGPQEMNREMDWGRRLEPVVFAKYAEGRAMVKGWHADPGGTYQSVERPYQVGSPDALAYDTASAWAEGKPSRVVEVKTSPMGDDWGRDGTDEIPVYYRCQALWYMDIFGAPETHFAVLISGCNYREYILPYDLSEAQILRDAAVAFLASLAADERPDIDGHSETYETVKRLHPQINGEKYDVPTDLAEWLVRSRLVVKAAEVEHAAARSTLADAMGDAKIAQVGKHKLADRRTKGDGHPYVQIASKLPTLEELRKPA